MKNHLLVFKLLFLILFTSCSKENPDMPEPASNLNGRLKSFTRYMPGNTFSKSDSTAVTYNSKGQVIDFSYIYPNGSLLSYVTFSYDNRGLLSEMRVPVPGSFDGIYGRKYLYNADSTVAVIMKNDSTGSNFNYLQSNNSLQINFTSLGIFSLQDYLPSLPITITNEEQSRYITLSDTVDPPYKYFRQISMYDSGIVEYRFINGLNPVKKKDIEEKYSGRAWEEKNPLYMLYVDIFKKALIPFRMEMFPNEFNFVTDHDLHVRDQSYRLESINDQLISSVQFNYDFAVNENGQVTMINKIDQSDNKIYEYHFYYE